MEAIKFKGSNVVFAENQDEYKNLPAAGAPTKQRLEPNTSGKTNTLTSVQKDNLVIQLKQINDRDHLEISNISPRIRRLTPVECERLQTVDDNYTSCVSDTQRYKMLGNGWTIEVIKHILSFMRTNKTNKTIKKKIMKKAPIIVSNNFPGTHARAGEETGFIEKIRKGEKIHTIRGNFEWWKERIQKIYRGEMYLSIRCWEGKPYHTKQIEMMKMHSVGYQEIEIVNKNG